MRFKIETVSTFGSVTSTGHQNRGSLEDARLLYEELRSQNAAKLRGANARNSTRLSVGIIEMSLTDQLTGDEYAYLLMVRRPSGDMYYVEGPDRNTAYVRFMSWSLPATPNLPEGIDPSVRTSPHTKDEPPDVWEMPVQSGAIRIREVDLFDSGKVREWVFPTRNEADAKFDELCETGNKRFVYVMAYANSEQKWITIRTR